MGDRLMVLKDIKGFEGLYAASDDGEIYSLRTKTPKLLKGGTNGRYRHYSLRKGGEQYQKLGHRLIAETFIPNPENKPTVNHIDGNKENNNINNLEWATKSENSKHAYKNGLICIEDSHLENMRKSFAEKNARFSEVEALNITAIYNNMEKPSCRKIAKAYNVNKSSIQRIINGSQKYFRNGDIAACPK